MPSNNNDNKKKKFNIIAYSIALTDCEAYVQLVLITHQNMLGAYFAV